MSAGEPGSMNWQLTSGYRENLSRQTWEGENVGVYWNPTRLALSSDYQFDVYLRARQIALQEGSRSILDIGSGPGLKAAKLFCDVVPDVVLIDQPTAETLVRERCPKATFVGTDLEASSLTLGRTFDVIVCADVIEHLLDPASCLGLIRQHADARTWIVLSTPERDYRRGLGCMACDKPEHVREWTGEEFAAMLGENGFQVVEHFVSPTLRPEADRGDTTRLWLEAFRPRPDLPGSRDPDMMRSCQVCICRLAPDSPV